jgi:hypothetical protein
MPYEKRSHRKYSTIRHDNDCQYCFQAFQYLIKLSVAIIVSSLVKLKLCLQLLISLEVVI